MWVDAIADFEISGFGDLMENAEDIIYLKFDS